MSALEEIGLLPDTILLTESLGARCERCGQTVTFTDRWIHADGTPKCAGAWAVSIPNTELFDALKGREQ